MKSLHEPAAATEAVDSADSLVGQLADDYLRRCEAGEQPSVAEYAARYPEHAERIRGALAMLSLLKHSSAIGSGAGGGDVVQHHSPLSGVLGDFRILHEIGRGGMGVVYEAEQISLGRRVALKILSFASILDPRQLTRFQNEARATATLNHPHIVPVHTTGVERGVHYLAMRLIDGDSLANYGLEKRDCGLQIADCGLKDNEESEIGNSQYPLTNQQSAISNQQSPTSTLRAAALSTLSPRDLQAWYRRVAQWGVEAADALDHAHGLGIVHRDIKPGNLLIDSTGKLWITDFGLARLPTDAGLTMTGDLLGTLRYMSPEQALARRGLVDHRTDIYSLGATLYELLTGRPAVHGLDRQQILKSLAEGEPTPLRKIAPQVSVDFETVVLKAISRETTDRYVTAKDFAEDLSRAIEGVAIRAKRAGMAKKSWQWMRHNVRAVVLVTLVAITAALASITFAVQRYAQFATTSALFSEANNESVRLQREFRWEDSLASAKRAKALVNAGVATDYMRQQAEERIRDLEAVLSLYDTRVEIAMRWEEPDSRPQIAERCAVEFRRFGIKDIDQMPVAESAALLRQRTVVTELAVALDAWAEHIAYDHAAWSRRIAVASAIDPDPMRRRIREAVQMPQAERTRTLTAISQEPEVSKQSPISLALLAEQLINVGSIDDALALLRKAQFVYPDDFWLNHHLGALLNGVKGASTEATQYLRVSVSKRPQSAVLHSILGDALLKSGKQEEARHEFELAVTLSPNSFVYKMAGLHACAEGKWDRAEEFFTKLLEATPNDAHLRLCLGNVFLEKTEFDRALAEFEKSLELKPNDAHVQSRISIVHRQKADWISHMESLEMEIHYGTSNVTTTYDAACAAVLAFDELDVASVERAELRRRALAWLTDSLKLADKEYPLGGTAATGNRINVLRHWQNDPELIPVREPANLAMIAEEEREQWEALWSKVRDMIADAEKHITAPDPESVKRPTPAPKWWRWAHDRHHYLDNHAVAAESLESKGDYQEAAKEAVEFLLSKRAFSDYEKAVLLLCLPSERWMPVFNEFRNAQMIGGLRPATAAYLLARISQSGARTLEERLLINDLAEQRMREALSALERDPEREQWVRMRDGWFNPQHQPIIALSQMQGDDALVVFRDAEILANLPEDRQQRWRDFWCEVQLAKEEFERRMAKASSSEQQQAAN